MTEDQIGTQGRICTFYSYKGGVGRSMALANVAVLLAQWGKRILVVDWDLEAPGIERYFENLITGRSEEVGTKNGVLEFAELISSGRRADWKQSVIAFPVPGSSNPLHLISAGRRDSGYVSRLQKLNWEELFESHDFGGHLEAMRDEWLGEYDYVLIDSRTGITDIGGICTIYLPDILVALFTANYQSVEGVADVVSRARRARSGLPVDRTALVCVPVPARDESRTEYEQSVEWRKVYYELLSDLYIDFLPKNVTATDALNLLRLPNVPYWSFGERLPVLTESASDPSGITYYYIILAKLLATDLSWLDSAPARLGMGVDTISRSDVGSVTASGGGFAIGSAGSIHVKIGPAPRSAYLEQVRDIAPLELINRDHELEELAAFCSGNEPYVWWQGLPWSGKTALMSCFVLDPPPGVDVVSFFVTGRLAGQDDSTAFTEALLEQLAAYLGESLPASLPLTGRDAHRKRLLRSAVERAEQAGRKLVLVVDGIDEDEGQSVQSHLPSIASQLPRPEEGLRVIVAGRPSPALPSDVPANHPLLRCPVKQLVPFAEAGIQRLARTELRDLITGDTARQDVVGCLTASGGGLSSQDLEELTSLAPYQLDLILQGTAGRSIAHRTAVAGDGSIEHVYLLAHEALFAEASYALGEKLLDGYRTRIHTWADSFKEKHWPDNTPTYLILGYPRMLVGEANIERLTEYALDEARHNWLQRRTGGDAATISEIVHAQGVILSQPEPDLLSLARLAFCQIHIDYQNRNIPINLPSVRALTGSPESGEALARSVPGPFRRTRALTELSRALTSPRAAHKSRELAADAEALSRSISDPYQRAQALGQLAMAMVKAGHGSQADKLALSITEPRLRAWVLSAVASALAAAGKLSHARQDAVTAAERARAMTDPGEQATALTWVARAYSDLGDAHRARMLADDAETAAHSITDPAKQAWSLAAVVGALAHSGDSDRARMLTQDAETAARSITDPAKQASVLAALARAAAENGDRDRARTLADDAETAARSITDPATLASALAGVVWAMAASHDYDEALTLADSITDPAVQASAIASVTERLTAEHQYDRADSLARQIIDHGMRASALAAVARALAQSGRPDQARSLARDAESAAHAADTGPDPQVRTLAAVARALAQNGRVDRAEHLAQSITDPAMQASALADVARALANTDPDRAEHLARRITDPAMQASALAAVARGLADSGDSDQSVIFYYSLTEPGARVHAQIEQERADLPLTYPGLPAIDVREGEQGFVADTIMAAAEERGHTENLIHAARSPQHWAKALTDVAQGYKAHEGARIARQIAAAALAYGPWAIALQTLGRVDPEALARFADDIGRKNSAAPEAHRDVGGSAESAAG